VAEAEALQFAANDVVVTTEAAVATGAADNVTTVLTSELPLGLAVL
jgi:hypothetical protein